MPFPRYRHCSPSSPCYTQGHACIRKVMHTHYKEKSSEQNQIPGVTQPDVRTIEDFKVTKFKVLKDFVEKVDMLKRWTC